VVPGKNYTPDEYLRILVRRKWLIVVPLVVTLCATAGYSWSLPNRYRSETVVLVVPQQVPRSYVQATVTTPIEERLQTIAQQILSRTRLERVVEEFNLYAQQRKTLVMEDVIEVMRKDINVDVPTPRRGGREATSTFRISFESEDGRTAMRVTERLASLFLKENLEDRELVADQTNQFLESQLEDARRRLITHEKRLEEFRRLHGPELPSQLQTNLQLVQNTQMQIQAMIDSLNRDRDRRLVLDRLLSDTASDASAANTTRSGTADPASPTGGSAAQQLDTARNSLAALQLRLKPQHPDVMRLKRQIGELEKRVEAEELQRPLSPEVRPAAPVSRADTVLRNRVASLRAEVESLDRQIATKQADEQRLRQLLASYQRRIEATPQRESEMVELTRDYDTLKTLYTDLLGKKENSKIAVNLERRQIGEQFKILDSARLPEKPASPDRLRINLIGTLGGLALGLAIVVLLEYRDTSLRTDDDVLVALSLPVLALVPVMVTTTDRRLARRRKRLIAASASLVVVIAAASAVAWKLGLLPGWVR